MPRIQNLARTNSGFSLIEVLVFVTIMSLVFVTAVSVVAVSLNNLKINEHKIMATRYAQELLEWLKEEKEIDWGIFYDRAGGGAGSAYCFNNDSIITSPTPSWPLAGQACGYNGITGNGITYPAFYKRVATLQQQGTSQVNITITVSWQENNQTYSVPLQSSVTVGE